jgi:hypothetical protein
MPREVKKSAEQPVDTSVAQIGGTKVDGTCL